MRCSLVTVTSPDGERYQELRERKDGQWALYSDLEQQHREYIEARDEAQSLRERISRVLAAIPSNWLRPGAVVPVDAQTTAHLVNCIQELEK